MGMTKDMVRKMMKGRNVVLLNVLPEEEFLKLRIQGSYNLPLAQNRDEFSQQVGTTFGSEKFFITYSAGITCAAGPNAAKALKARGFHAEDYPGGVQEWQDSGLPTEGLQARQPVPSR
jgi:rhodanese-related sulfurtransferase